MTKEQAQVLREVTEIKVPLGSRWRHYKGGTYEVIAVSCMEEKPEVILVTYRSELHGSSWTRTATNWLEAWQETGAAPQHRFVRI